MTAYLAWLIGVSESEVQAYLYTTQWPSHWTFMAQHRMRALGVSTEREALNMFRTQCLYG